MKQFMKNIPVQICSTYSTMVTVFFIISFCMGVETIPLIRLGQLALVAVLGSILMELYFGTGVIKNMADITRSTLFVISLAAVTFVCAVHFQWITKLDSMRTYLSFIGAFAICWVVAIILGELEHYFRGKKYTQKLKEYQKRGDRDGE